VGAGGRGDDHGHVIVTRHRDTSQCTDTNGEDGIMMKITHVVRHRSAAFESV
jgi:hypothetical protein